MASFDLLIHGTPSGFQYKGVAEERSYCETFYQQGNTANTESGVKLVIEIRQSEKGPFCYYTFLRFSNVADVNGRTGAYFSLTLRTDFYLSDSEKVFSLFEMLYDKDFVGQVLTDDGTNAKFKIATFDAMQQGSFKNVEEKLGRLIESLFLFSSLQYQPTTDRKVYKYYAPEADSKNVQSLLVAGHRVELMRDVVHSKAVKSYRNQFETQLNSERVKQQSEINALQEEIKRKDDSNTKSKQKHEQEYQKLKEEFYSLQQRYDVLRGDVENLAKKHGCKIEVASPQPQSHNVPKSKQSGVEQTAKKGMDMQTDSSTSKGKDRSTYHPPKRFSIEKIGYALIAVIAVVLLALGVYFYFGKGEEPENSAMSAQTNTEENTAKAIIDIKEYSGSGALQVDSAYTIQVKNPNHLGILIVDPSDIVELQEPNHESAILKIKKEGSFSIFYVVKEDTTVSRSLEAKK